MIGTQVQFSSLIYLYFVISEETAYCIVYAKMYMQITSRAILYTKKRKKQTHHLALLCVRTAWAVPLFLTVKHRTWCSVFDWSLLLITTSDAEVKLLPASYKQYEKWTESRDRMADEGLYPYRDQVMQNTVNLRHLAEKSRQSSSAKTDVLKLHILWVNPIFK